MRPSARLTTWRPVQGRKHRWKIATRGPSPFDPNIWAAHISCPPGGRAIYWVDDLRLPDASDGEFTVEGQGCEAKRAEVGVT
jgi:hypothetical protein